VSIHKVLGAGEFAGSHRNLHGVEEVHSSEVCNNVSFDIRTEEPRILRVVVWLGWVLLRGRCSISSVVS
jgi:hypothetical protein